MLDKHLRFIQFNWGCTASFRPYRMSRVTPISRDYANDFFSIYREFGELSEKLFLALSSGTVEKVQDV